MKRYIQAAVARDLTKKMVFITGPRQAGKTTLSKAIMAELLTTKSSSSAANARGLSGSQYLNYDVAPDRALIERRAWNARSELLIFDEIHKMPLWKAWLKGVYDGKPEGQKILVTGSARLDIFRRTGDSLAGRFFSFRLNPISVREWCNYTSMNPEAALSHLLERGGFPEPCLAETKVEAQRWRRDYFDGLVRDDVLEFSRLHEVQAMRLFVELLRNRVGSPLSLASIARDLHIAPTTLKKYLDILEALYIVFTVRPWHKNIARATLQAPKIYFYDTGFVMGGEGAVFENLVAISLLKHLEYLRDIEGQETDLHYVRTKDGAEVDFAISQNQVLTELIECKVSDAAVHKALLRFSLEFPEAKAVQLVRDLRNEYDVQNVKIAKAANWLHELSA